MTTDPIDIIDGALRLFDGGRNWGQRMTWNGVSACLGGGLAAQVVDMDAQSRVGLAGLAFVWPMLPVEVRAAVVTAITDRCHRCRGARAAGRIDRHGGDYPATESALVATHNDSHVRDYAEIAALLHAVKAALVGEPEREAVTA